MLEGRDISSRIFPFLRKILKTKEKEDKMEGRMMVIVAYCSGVIIGLMVGLHFGLILGGMLKRKGIEEKQLQIR